jgi:hypothetical protein
MNQGFSKSFLGQSDGRAMIVCFCFGLDAVARSQGRGCARPATEGNEQNSAFSPQTNL